MQSKDCNLGSTKQKNEFLNELLTKSKLNLTQLIKPFIDILNKQTFLFLSISVTKIVA